MVLHWFLLVDTLPYRVKCNALDISLSHLSKIESGPDSIEFTYQDLQYALSFDPDHKEFLKPL